MVSPRHLLRFALANALNFLILTDHDTIDGSLALRREVKRKKVALEVPIAAEYKTSHGDIIAVFIEEEIQARELTSFVSEVQEQGGLLLLPHPYNNHKDVERLAEIVDLIEVFNSRSSEANNEASLKLALRHAKGQYWAPDAHISGTLSRALVSVESTGSLKNSLSAGGISPIRALPASRSDLWISQYVKAIKTRSPRLFFNHTLSIVLSVLRRD
jgi:predicted metal-dependent phosphoesterase TrpH